MLQAFEPQQPSLHYGTAPTMPVASINNTTSSQGQPALKMASSNHHHIFIVTGPAGCGKSTVAKFMADRYGFEYIEGDDFHPQANLDKMKNNIPLEDADRWDWLIILRDEALMHLRNGAKGVVVTCSALKKKYRDVIRTADRYADDPNTAVTFIYLKASMDTLKARVSSRKDHYMKDSMVESQFQSLEEPDDAEIERLKDVRIVSVEGSQDEVKGLASQAVDQVLLSDGAEPKTP